MAAGLRHNDEAKRDVTDYIVGFYNSTRLAFTTAAGIKNLQEENA